jgi:hypothetical protein
MVTFESLFPIRLSELVGGTDQAAAIMGPVGSAAWFASAAGAAGIIVVSRRIGVARSAALLRVVQGATVVAMGLIAGIVGVIVAYLACYTAHGASNPMHTTLLHRQVDGPHRTTVLSMNSMVGQPPERSRHRLAALADATSVSTAMVIGGIILADGGAALSAGHAPGTVGAADTPGGGTAGARRVDSAACPTPRPRARRPCPRSSDCPIRAPSSTQAGPFLERREAEHNLLFGIAATLIADPQRPMTARRSSPSCGAVTTSSRRRS